MNYNLYGKTGLFKIKNTEIPITECTLCGETEEIYVYSEYSPVPNNRDTAWYLECKSCNVTTSYTSDMSKIIAEWETGQVTKKPIPPIPMYWPDHNDLMIELLEEKNIPYVYHQYGQLVDKKYYLSSKKRKWCKVGTAKWYNYKNANDFYNRIYLNNATTNEGIIKENRPLVDTRVEDAIKFFESKGVVVEIEKHNLKLNNEYLFSPKSNRWINIKYNKDKIYFSEGWNHFYNTFMNK